MIQFDKPDFLDGKILIDQLKDAGVTVNDDSNGEAGKPYIDADNKFYLPIDESDRSTAQEVLDNH